MAPTRSAVSAESRPQAVAARRWSRGVAGERGLGQHGASQGQRIAGPGVGVQAAAEGERGIRHPCGLAGGQALVQALDDGTQQVGQLRARDDRQARLGLPEGLEECGASETVVSTGMRGG